MRGRTLYGESIDVMRRTVRFDLANAHLKGIKLAFGQGLGDARKRGSHREESGESQEERRYSSLID
jgi:hypothetical protein